MAKAVIPSNEELKHRIIARKLELEAKLENLKADTVGKTAEVRKSIQKDLDYLGTRIKESWENLSEAAVRDYNDWFKRTDKY
jgi:hypothetical protein